MNLSTLSLRNVRRNRTRTILTVLGVMVAVVAFGFLRTAINAYFIGVEASAEDRLITRHKASLVMTLPMAYKDRIARIPGVTKISTGVWFGAYYRDPNNFFANFAVDPEFPDLYPEFLMTPEERQAWTADRTGAVVGQKLATQYNWKLGDVVTLKGTSYPGDWKFTIRGIYRPRDRATDATGMFFHFKYIDEAVEPERKGQAGWYYVGIADPAASPQIARAIDGMFKDTPHETLTESEKAFQLSFIGMVSAVITALQVISVFVLVIIALILGNTIAMSVRDRGAEGAVLKAMGFRGGRIALMIAGESATIAALGGVIGILASLPVIWGFGLVISEVMGNFFPVFELERSTMLAMAGLSVAVGILASLVPAIRVARQSVASSLRQIA